MCYKNEICICICLTPRRHNLDHIEAVLLGQNNCCHTGIVSAAQYKNPTKSHRADEETRNRGQQNSTFMDNLPQDSQNEQYLRTQYSYGG